MFFFPFLHARISPLPRTARTHAHTRTHVCKCNLPPPGHLDGSLCLWDMRQDRAGGKPLAEVGEAGAHARANTHTHTTKAHAHNKHTHNTHTHNARTHNTRTHTQLRDSAQTVLSLSPNWAAEGLVLAASKDSSLRLWDFRALSVAQVCAHNCVHAWGAYMYMYMTTQRPRSHTCTHADKEHI